MPRNIVPDKKVLELVAYFFGDHPELYRPQSAAALAVEIQYFIASWIEAERERHRRNLEIAERLIAATLPEGVTVVDMSSPRALHDGIAKAVGEDK